jgi:hypothetical protein
MFVGHRALALNRLGRGKEALSSLEEAIAACRSSEDLWSLPELLRLRATILSGERPDDAQAALDEAWEMAKHSGMRSWSIRSATSAVRLFPNAERFSERLEMIAATFEEGRSEPVYATALAVLSKTRPSTNAIIAGQEGCCATNGDPLQSWQ